jgi:hypothetical protein
MKAQDILKFGQKGSNQPTVEQAKAAMLAAGEAPGSVRMKAANDARRQAFREAQLSGHSIAEAREIAAQAAEDAANANTVALAPPNPAARVEPVEPAIVNAAKVVTVRTAADQRAGITQPVSLPVAQDQKAERLETTRFTAEIKQSGGQWVCELIYKNGAGTERFVAPTKSMLMLKLAEGKGNATVKIRQDNRAARLGMIEYDHNYSFPDLTQKEFDDMPEAAKKQLIDATAAKAVIMFKEEHPEFYPSAFNSDKMTSFLDSKKATVTFGNLEKALESLTLSEELEARPDNELPTVLDDSAATVDSLPAAATAPAVSTVATVAASEPQVRKRGTLGLMPGVSSGGGDTTLDTTEEGVEQREPSRAELMSLSLEEHRKLFKKTLKQPNRQF